MKCRYFVEHMVKSDLALALDKGSSCMKNRSDLTFSRGICMQNLLYYILVSFMGVYNNSFRHKLSDTYAKKFALFFTIGFLPISRGEGKKEEKESLFRGRHSVK